MLFLVNPGNRKDRVVKRGKKVKARRVARRRKRAAKNSATQSGGNMARRRRSRAKARVSAPRRRRSVRRRRRVAVAVRRAAPRRRRRAVTLHRNPRHVRRRRYHRNPGMGGTIKNGVIDGATVLAGEIVQNKAVALVDHLVPTMTGVAGIARTAGLNLAIATAGTMAARKFVPSRSRMLSAGLFARALANIVATTPAAGLLGDGAVYDASSDGRYGAYPAALGAGFAAYPSVATVDVSHAEH